MDGIEYVELLETTIQNLMNALIISEETAKANEYSKELMLNTISNLQVRLNVSEALKKSLYERLTINSNLMEV